MTGVDQPKQDTELLRQRLADDAQLSTHQAHELAAANDALRERGKELSCLYELSTLIERPKLSLDELLDGTVRLIPPAWQYPEVTAARITVGAMVAQTDGFRETPWMQTAQIETGQNQPAGTVQVCYLAEYAQGAEAPFLVEERTLLGAIAQRIGRFLARKQVDDALAESELQYRTLGETIPYGVWRCDATGYNTYASPSFLEMMGMTMEQCQQFGWLHLLPPEDVEPTKEAWLRSVRTGEDFRKEHRFRSKSHGWRNVLAIGRPIRDAKGEISSWVGINLDVTDRKLAEAEVQDLNARRRADERLLRSQAMLARAESTAHLGSWEWEVATDTVTWSDEMFRIFRVDPTGGAPSMTEQARFYDREGGQRVAAAIDATLAGAAAFEVELRLTPGDDGEIRACVVRGRLDATSAGDRPRLIGTTQDVTERSRTEQALRESEARWRFALEGAGDGVWDWNAQTDQVFFSQQLKAQLGFEVNEIGDTLAEWDSRVHPDDREATFAALSPHLNGATPVYVSEHRLRCKDGTYKWILDRGKVITRSEDGKPLRVIGTHADISVHKELEAQLRQAQKMTAVGQLAGGVAHDFNNILAAMVLQLNMLRLEPDVPPEVLQETTDELLESANRAANLVKQLLLFSRRQVMQTSRHDANVVVGEIVKLLDRLLGERAPLTVERASEPQWIDADSGMIQQAVTNLCLNARDAMPDGGQLSVTIRRVTLDADAAKRHHAARPGVFVCLSVADTGSGMSPEVLEHLFEPFFTTKEQGKGTGLGLATVDGIVAKHRGWVEVESQVGKGSTFTVYLPPSTAPGASDPRAPVATLRRGSERILVAEDEPTVRRMAVRCLARLGYRVTDAASGAEALQVWERERGGFDLLFTDMVMPGGLSGLELAEKLRQSKANLPIIVASGYSIELLQDENRGKQELTFLSKPYDITTLAATVRECLEKKS